MIHHFPTTSRADATKTLKNDYQQIKDVLKQIADDTEEKGCVRAEALLKQINRLETGIYTTFYDILQRTHATNKKPQMQNSYLNSAVVLLRSWRDQVASKRDSIKICDNDL